MKSHTFSTNVEDNRGSEFFGDGEVEEVDLVAFSTPQIPFLNGKYTNKSTLSLDLHVFVASF